MKLLVLIPLILMVAYLWWDHYTFWKQMGYYGKVKKDLR